MARLVTSGFEILDHPTSDIGHPDGFAAGTAMCVSDLSVFRSGKAACRCDGTATDNSYRSFPFTVPTLGTAIFDRVYLRFSALPASTVKVSSFTTAASGAIVSVRLTSGGKLQLWDDVAGTQIGSDSTLTVEVDRFYRIQSSLVLASGATDSIELRAKVDDYQAIEEVVAAASSLNLGDTHAGRTNYGWIDAPGVTASLWLDDVAVNDSTTGAGQQSWPDDGKVVWLVPRSAGTVGSWTDCAGGTAVHNGANKLPPVGLADHTTAGHTGASAHQDRCAVNTLQSMTLNTATLPGAGVLGAAGTMQDSTTSTSQSGIGYQSTANGRAQSFMFGIPVVIDSVTLRLSRSGSPTDNIWFELRTDSGGVPSGSILASTAQIGASSIGTTVANYTYTFDTVVTLDAGVSYWIVAQRSGATSISAVINWFKKTTASDLYTDGEPAMHNGTAWVKTGTGYSISDHNMRIIPLQGVWPPVLAVAACCHGQGVTGAKTGSINYTVLANPSTSKAFTFGDNAGVAGTYPTNWRWTIGNYKYKPNGNWDQSTFITVAKDSGSGTNACLVCAAGIHVEYWLPPLGWSRWQKTADATFWWAKRLIGDTAFEKADGTVLTVDGGDWVIYPEPQIGEGENFPATTISVTDSTLQSGYTPV